ncbi:MAG: NTP transferase domain-containing protein [Elusimicrobia bacterium]|nr:NTP transferase domain-containing protein [Elusimicrobiota bacterium]
MSRQAVILAGGKGTRLRPFTTTLPKPLVPVGDLPILEVVLRQLKHHGFRDIVISVGHLAGLIEAYCGDGRRWGLKIRYVRESRPLSTAGALKLIRGLAPDFLTINGDLLTTLDYRALYDAHRKSGASATVAVCERRTMVDFGVVELDDKDRLAAYTEKPSYRYLVSMGVNVFDRKTLELIARNETLGIPDLIGRIRADGGTVRGFRNKAEWLDIGRPEDYQTAQDLFSDPQKRAKYLRS